MHEAFEVHMLDDGGKKLANKLARDFDELLGKITDIVPEGRELSIVRTKLEEACFFAKKGMAREHSV